MQHDNGSKLFVIVKDDKRDGHEIVCHGFRKEIIDQCRRLNKFGSPDHTWRKATQEDSLRDVPHVKKLVPVGQPFILNR